MSRTGAVPVRRLGAAEDYCRAVFDQSMDAVLLTVPDGRIVMANPAATELFGYTEDELRRLGRQAVVDPADPQVRAALEERRRTGRFRGELTMRCKDGTPVPVEVSSAIFQDDRGAEWTSMFIRDIRERKQREAERERLARELHARRLWLEAVLERVPVCIILFEPGGTVYANRGAQALFGMKLSPAGGIAQYANRMRSPDGMPVPPERLLASRALDTGETVLGAELLVEKADGSSVPVLGGSAPIRDGDGRVIGGVVVLQDMTQLKEVEAALRRAVRARDEVLGIVAHDLRSPLGAVLLQAQVLQAQRGILPERAGKAVDRIERQAKRMDRLIQDLLDVIRIDAGALSMEHGRIAVQELLGEVLETQGQIAAADSIRLRLDLNDRPPDVWGDRDRLMQVFENLIANAIKFTGPGGSITVGARPAEGSTLFWVADDGPGVSAELLPHLFDPFWQASRRDRRGAGLGLQISKGIVEAQGGRIWVESEPGRGATFYFTVPAEGAAP